MAPQLEISIPTTSVSTPAGSKPFTLYSISLRQPIRSYVIQKRYSDFIQLQSELKKQAGDLPPEPLPKKSWLKSTISSPELTEARRKTLEAYLRAINDASDPRWRNTEVWKRFLGLPNSLSGTKDSHPAGSNLAAGPRHIELQAAIIDPNVWLDVHRELKTQLTEARKALRQRDTATSAQTQHEANAEVKRWLVRSGTVIIALEAGLNSASGTSVSKGSLDESNKGYAKPPQMGEGEIRRRKDLLSAARKERDGLERQLNSYVAKKSDSHLTDRSSAPWAEEKSQDPREEVGSSNAVRPTNPSTGRRVLGAPKETEQTRQLDNNGVLQLQQQIMEAQDQDVTALTQVVARIKDMGIQINDELDIQNEMLRILDSDVDRVGSKIDIAKKRIDKIN